jgi:hypothetical protein
MFSLRSAIRVARPVGTRVLSTAAPKKVSVWVVAFLFCVTMGLAVCARSSQLTLSLCTCINAQHATLVLLRHGQSQWNLDNLFTGWADVPLTAQGQAEAKEAGRLIGQENILFDVAHTSVLKRAIKTLWLALEEMDAMWLPVKR